ncbi:glycosyltransferase [Halobacillus halophilus]|uniref:glycosyltransferase n=1 Tax=Halobacillus halophilus TaxID=1570 RepID=UPI001CD53619|nr:glycosyltransferase [Halobacillus halophilus]MCA1010087.1 glycosyltransferase [Halobacillus halophilus]
MKHVLIASFDMEVGGVERSLIGMLNHFDYENYHIDLMLYSHTGDFMKLLPSTPNLLEEMTVYKTFRMSISETIKNGKIHLGFIRLIAKMKAELSFTQEKGYRQMQYMWKYSLPFLPKLSKRYDVAISYLWPHYFVAEKVEANTKIAWIHTDYSMVNTDVKLDLDLWNKFNYIIAVSEDCRNAFLDKYPRLASKVEVMENIASPNLIRSLSMQQVSEPMYSDKRFKIVTVARLSYAKGIDQAVKAMKKLIDLANNIVWYVIGYGGDEGEIRKMIAEYELEDHFILLGKKINPYPYIKEADLYVQPSRYEGKAVTVTEASILNKPILITNYPTARSQIIDGVNGYICAMGSDGLYAGIRKLYENKELRNKVTNSQQYTQNAGDELNKIYDLVNAAGKQITF